MKTKTPWEMAMDLLREDEGMRAGPDKSGFARELRLDRETQEQLDSGISTPKEKENDQ